MTLSRRALLAGLPALAVAACSPDQAEKIDARVDAVKARVLRDLQRVSARFTAAATRLATHVPGGIAAAPLARIQANDLKIQAATELGPVLMTYARAAVQAGDDLLKVAEFVPGAGPYVEVLRGAMRVLRTFSNDGEIPIAY